MYNDLALDACQIQKMLEKMQQKAGADNSQPLGSVNIMSVWEKDPERSSLSGGKDSEGKFLI